MEYLHIQKNLGHSPRKMRLLADMVRKMTPQQALQTLKFTNRAAAIDLSKAIKTAIANASGKKDLSFKKLEVNEGFKSKRFRAAPRGRARPYVKRTSQIRVVLSDELTLKSEKQKNEKGGMKT